MTMRSKLLERLWTELSLHYDDNEERINGHWQEIKKCYQADNRYYHNLNHLLQMVNLALDYQGKLKEPDLILYSIFYHDIIYNAKSGRNEERSAELAKLRLSDSQLSFEKITAIQAQIMATKEHLKSDNSDTNYLLDFDLAILGSERKDYEDYCIAIRKEYAVYPNFLYRKGRKKVIKHFLNQEYIYHSEEAQDRFEDRARMNLKSELKKLA